MMSDGDVMVAAFACFVCGALMGAGVIAGFCGVQMKSLQAEAVRRGHAEFVLSERDSAEWRWKE
jgi:hypothetical protein